MNIVGCVDSFVKLHLHSRRNPNLYLDRYRIFFNTPGMPLGWGMTMTLSTVIPFTVSKLVVSGRSVEVLIICCATREAKGVSGRAFRVAVPFSWEPGSIVLDGSSAHLRNAFGTQDPCAGADILGNASWTRGLAQLG